MKKGQQMICINGIAVAPFDKNRCEDIGAKYEISSEYIGTLQIYYNKHTSEYGAIFYGIDGIPSEPVWDGLFFSETGGRLTWQHSAASPDYFRGLKRVKFSELSEPAKELLLDEIAHIQKNEKEKKQFPTP